MIVLTYRTHRTVRNPETGGQLAANPAHLNDVVVICILRRPQPPDNIKLARLKNDCFPSGERLANAIPSGV